MMRQPGTATDEFLLFAASGPVPDWMTSRSESTNGVSVSSGGHRCRSFLNCRRFRSTPPPEPNGPTLIGVQIRFNPHRHYC